ncbi:helix-turn-helix domain-containing protein [Nocardioides sp.]|uniref:ATP-binding protein n=1 Tax=Nocardioides sp. TaxID=35761 RepID=UPI0027330882|nr:helix-turn-helix domain-containing protein [Nocardioides sp.]MDP3891188.1 helix-turn-helix domain-containing protein [Nocardioides sp.]
MSAVPDPGELAVRLRRWRQAAALTQDELAERAGLTAKAIGALERGERRRPYPHTVRALADALELDEADRATLTAAAAPGVPTSPRPASPEPTRSMPVPATPLIGRRAEHDRAVGLLRSGPSRLLTLTGTGGVGKTRLALEVAETMSTELPGAVKLVELAAVPDPHLVLPAVAQSLGGAQRSGPALESIAAAVGGTRHLIVLDNLEHVVDVAAELAELLERCPELLVLATSRAALHVRAEHVLPVAPLAVPAADDLAAIAASPAVLVFLDRAAAAGSPVVLDEAAAPDVAAICRRLDGLPLALELAAAHARFLAPSALLEHLDQALASPRSRDLPARQRTIRTTLDWSHGLLTHGEQVLLRRLSVLAGTFSLAAAEAVAGGELDTLGGLAGLVDQSLLAPQGGTEPRFRALEPVRQYAAERLADAGELDTVADRAAAYFVGLATEAGIGLRGADQAAALDRLAREHGHLGTTLDRLASTGRLGDAARFAADIWLYWALRGNAAEGLARLDGIAAAGSADHRRLTPQERAGLHTALAGLRYASGDLAGMCESAARAIEAGRLADDVGLLDEALVLAGSAAVVTGDLDRATTLIAEVCDGNQTANDWATVHAHIARAQLHLARGDVSSASLILDQAERSARDLGNPFTLATLLNMRATVAQAAGREGAALGCLVEAAELASRVATSWTLVYTLPGLAVLAARGGQPELAAELFAAGSATAEAASLAMSFPPDQESARHWLLQVQAQLGSEAFAQAWDAGRRATPTDVPALALRVRAPL